MSRLTISDKSSEVGELDEALLETGLVKNDFENPVNATVIEIDWNPLKDYHLEERLTLFDFEAIFSNLHNIKNVIKSANYNASKHGTVAGFSVLFTRITMTPRPEFVKFNAIK